MGERTGDAVYVLRLDDKGDETYTTELPLISCEWSNGMSNPYDQVADTTRLVATLANPEGALTSGVFGDFTLEERIQLLRNEQLKNGSFTQWSGGLPMHWSVSAGGATISESAPNGGAGTGAAKISGTGTARLSQYVTHNRDYEVTLVISQLSAGARVDVTLAEGLEYVSEAVQRTFTAAGTYKFPMEVEGQAFFTLRVAVTGTQTAVLDEVSVKEIRITYGGYHAVNEEILGDDIVVNGDFNAWTGNTPNGWTVWDPTIEEVGSGQGPGGTGTGACNFYEATSGLTAAIRQTVQALNYHYYRFDVTISYLSGTNARVQVGTASANFWVTLSTTGTHVFRLRPRARDKPWGATVPVDTDIRVIGTALPVSATVDKISIRPVTVVTRYVKDPDTYTVLPDSPLIERIQSKKGTLVKLVVRWRGQEYQLWNGKISDIQITPSRHGNRTVQVVCVDPSEELMRSDFMPPLRENATVDVAIRDILRTVITPWPYMHSYWFLGVHGASELGINTHLWDGTPATLQTGVSTFSYLGDVSDRATPSVDDDRAIVKKGVSALAYLRDLLTAEDGRFWWDNRTSKFVFVNRHADFSDAPPMLMLDDFIEGTFGLSKVYNRITLHYSPRAVGNPGETIYQHPGVPFTIQPEETRTIRVRYHDPNDASVRVAAKDVIPPVRGVDFASNVGGRLHVHAASGAQGAVITLTNTNPNTAATVTLLRLRGTPIRAWTPASVEVNDAESQYSNEIRPLDIRATIVDTEAAAEGLANHYLAYYRDCVRRFSSVTLEALLSEERLHDILTLTLGARVRVKDDFVSHNAVYVVVGEKHQYTAMPRSHRVTLVLKPVGSANFWLLAQDIDDDTKHSTLGVSTYPVY